MNRAILFAALLCACHQTRKTPVEDPLAQQPQLQPLKPFDAPVPRVETLQNGLKVYLVERKGDGIEAIQFIARAGATADPKDSPGLASLTAALMETGAAGRSQTEIAAQADSIGASLAVGATQDALFVATSAMETNVGPMIELLAAVALRPDLAEAEWNRVRTQREAALVAQRAEPGVAALRVFHSAAYGANPLARPVEGTLASVKAMQLPDVKRFYQGISPRETALIAVGGASAESVLALLRRAFETWQPRSAPLPPVASPPVPAERPRFTLADFPGKPQSVLVVGQPAVPRSSPDFLALQALNSILGGSFTSRLNQNLREEHGYSYGAGSSFAFGSGPGPFSARSSVKTDVTGLALGEMLKEIQRAVAEPLAPAELDKARALLAYQLVETLSHSDALSRAVAQMFLYDLPADEFRTFVPRLQALTPESVQAAARRVLDPAQMTIAIAGDKSKVMPQLGLLQLPAPQLRDPSGELLH
jgi:zinc protease